MKVSILIPTLNEEKYIGKLLGDIRNQSKAPHEVIVIDAGSKDKTTSIVKEHDYKLIKSEPNIGLQRDIAGKEATGDLLIYLDADTRVRPHFIDKVSKAYYKGDFNFACPIYVPKSKNLIVHGFFASMNAVFFMTQNLMPSGAGMCMIVDKDTFNIVNGFKHTKSYEDMDFLNRASKHGQFKTLLARVHASDRRFQEYGTIKTIAKYLKLSGLFFLNKHETASDEVEYEFGAYKSD